MNTKILFEDYKMRHYEQVERIHCQAQQDLNSLDKRLKDLESREDDSALLELINKFDTSIR